MKVKKMQVTPDSAAVRRVVDLPHLDEFPSCSGPIRGLRDDQQPEAVIRELYWLARALHDKGWGLRTLSFSPADRSARMKVLTPTFQAVEYLRRDGARPAPSDLPTLLLESVWRLGVAGWDSELTELVALLWRWGILQNPARISVCERPIHGARRQPERAVRVAYWWARELMSHGWIIEALGEEAAGGGFVADIPGIDHAPRRLAIYPRGMVEDGTPASALANHLHLLTGAQCDELTVLLAAAGPIGRQVS